MPLEEKLASWTAAGLLSDEQAQAIRGFEARPQPGAGVPVQGRVAATPPPTQMSAGTGLVDSQRGVTIASSVAGLAIALGVIAVIASNWDSLPGVLKIAADFSVLGLMGVGLVNLRERRVDWAFDALLLAFGGLVLGSAALVLQQFQLNLTLLRVLPFFFVAVTPALLLGRGTIVAGVWVLLAAVSWYALVFGSLPDKMAQVAGPSIVLAFPLALATLGEWMRRREPSSPLAVVGVRMGWSMLAISASVASFYLYGNGSSSFTDLAGAQAVFALLLPLAVVLGLAALLTQTLRRSPSDASAPGDAVHAGAASARIDALLRLTWVSVAVLLVPLLPLTLVHGMGSSLLAAAVFIAYWIFVGQAAARAGWMRGLDAAAVVLGVRLLAVYIEVFGTLLNTGLALIGGGLLTLVLISVWVRRRKTLLESVAVGGSQGET